MNKEQLIQALQAIVTGLSNQAEMHMFQGKIFEDQEFTKLAEKYTDHAAEEREFQRRFIQRIFDLGGEVSLEAREPISLYKDPIDFIKADYEISKEGLAGIKDLTSSAISDHTTYDLLKEYYADEEDDMLWSESQLELAEKIGKENWLYAQL